MRSNQAGCLFCFFCFFVGLLLSRIKARLSAAHLSQLVDKLAKKLCEWKFHSPILFLFINPIRKWRGKMRFVDLGTGQEVNSET